MHMKLQLAVVVSSQVDCCTSLALHTRTISEMPRKIGILAKMAMDMLRYPLDKSRDWRPKILVRFAQARAVLRQGCCFEILLRQ